MNDHVLRIADELSKRPATEDAEAFRERTLIPALDFAIATQSRLLVSFDGLEACPWAFVEAAFGGLARQRRYEPGILERRLATSGSDAASAARAAEARACVREVHGRMAA